MLESLAIKDGIGSLKNLQVSSGSNGYISNHTIVSTATGSNIEKYYVGGPFGWDWQSANSGTVNVADYDSNRKNIIIFNNTELGKCYVLVGSSSFGTIIDIEKAPPYYSFLLDAGGTYSADTTLAPLQHMIYVPSASNISDAESMTVTVTQIY